MESTHHHHHHDHYEPVIPPYWPRYPKWPYPDIMWSSTTGTPPSPQFTCDSNSLGAAGNAGPVGCEGINMMYCAQVNTTSPGASTRELDASINSIKCSMASSVPDFKLGTGWGEARVDQVTETTFERDRELCTLSIYYAESADLERVGIRLVKELAVTPAAPVLPQAFAGFCKPPIKR